MWTLSKDIKDASVESLSGNTFLIGNGYMGVRGTADEAGAAQFAAVNLAGVYDRVGDKWRETVNAPNPFFTCLEMPDGKILGIDILPQKHIFSLDIKRAVFSRVSRFSIPAGVIKIEAERFVSKKRLNIGALKYTVTAEQDIGIKMRTGIDCAAWELNGPHMSDCVYASAENLTVTTITQENKIPITVRDFVADCGLDYTINKDKNGIFRQYELTLKAGKPFNFYKIISIEHGKVFDFEEAKTIGYDALLREHASEWAVLWEDSDVVIHGSEYDCFNLRYSIYHLLLLAPRHTEYNSIAARGLSGQTYKGAVFWDTEIFMLPFFINTDIITAKNIIMYRVHTLSGAMRKAREYGYRGAFYAWESQDTGDDACSEYNVTDVFTGKPLRTYFRDKQIHISGDVAYAVMQYIERTGDTAILTEGAADVIIECAAFFASYAVYNQLNRRYELNDVVGPDEYHERVNNNAFTNRLALNTLQASAYAVGYLKQHNPEYLDNIIKKYSLTEDLELIEKVRKGLYQPLPDKNGVIEQFDGYFQLTDSRPSELRGKLRHPNEYWGGKDGVAVNTQVIKQADIVTMLELFNTDKEVRRACWEYYEPRTEHGSSLSACMYAIGAIRIGNPDWAYPYFEKTSSLDITGNSKQWAGGIFIGGTHPAANGGAYMTAVNGFAGLSIMDGKIMCAPKLPKHWTGMEFKIKTRGFKYSVKIDGNNVSVIKL